MRRWLVAILVPLALAPPAAAAAPSLSPADRAAIGVVVDRFVKDNVLRENLADGWTIAGPWLRGGTTRKAWVAGTGVTVPAFPIAGRDFRRAWTLDHVRGSSAVLSMVMHPRKGAKGWDETVVSITVHKTPRGGWIVDLFTPAAVFSSGGQIYGPNDFKALGHGLAPGNASTHIAGRWLLIGIGAAGALVVLGAAGGVLYVRRRDRRALAYYLSGGANQSAENASTLSRP